MTSTRTGPQAPAVPWLAAALLALAGLPARAGQTTFNPSLELQQGYQENLFFVADPVESDQVRWISLVLPVQRQWDRGGLTFLYRPSLVRFADFEVFDRDEHLVQFGMNSRPSAQSRVGLQAQAERTQSQGNAKSTGDADLFLAPRENRDLGVADVSYEHDLGRAWHWRLALGASAFRYTPVVEGAPVSEDRAEYRGTVDVSRLLSATQRLGLQYSAQAFDFELDPDVTNDAVRAVWGKELDRDYGFELGAGAYRLSGEVDGVTEVRTGFDGFFRLHRKLRRGALGLELSNAPSSGGNLKGTSINSVIAFYLTGESAQQVWAWTVAPRLAYRDPVDEFSDTVASAALEAALEWRMVHQVGLRLGFRYVLQSQERPSGDPLEDIESYGASLGLLWYPFAGTRLAGR